LAITRTIVAHSLAASKATGVSPIACREFLGSGTFDLHHLFVELMKGFQKNIFHGLLRIKTDEAKATRPLSIVVIHNNHICDSTKLSEILSEVIFCD
jgi:hypothetical protein